LGGVVLGVVVWLVVVGFGGVVVADYELVGAVEDGEALVKAAQQTKPDLILLDISMPLLNGIEAARQIRKVLPTVKFIFLTMHTDPTYVTEAFKAGASGYLLKRSATSELLCAIQEVLEGRNYVTPLITKDLMHSIMEIIRVTESSPS
jgi:DNA-binding NarL/FixJ family response regulator